MAAFLIKVFDKHNLLLYNADNELIRYDIKEEYGYDDK